ncbi:hypothetical protein [Brenneria alni]|nr:hypothetical protein [Brenneria alni]
MVFRNNAMRGIVNQPFAFVTKYKADTQPAAKPVQSRDVKISDVTMGGSE